MIIKCIRLLCIYKLMAPCVAMLCLSCSSTAFTMLVWVVFVSAYSSLGHIIFLCNSYPFISVLKSLQAVVMYLLGVGWTKPVNALQSATIFNQVSAVCFYGTFFVVVTVLWTRMLRGILTSVAKDTKKVHNSKHLVTFTQVTVHAREKVLSIVGHQRLKSTDGTSVTGNNFYLEEFEDLIDELLFRLNAILDSLHHSLPAKLHCNTQEEEDNRLESFSDYYFCQTSENQLLCEESIQKKENLAEDHHFLESVIVDTDLDR
ncbi:polycystin-1-like protein 1 [Ascaphus truei]|uniref:polycystin-1-like protein 1 n=1 Tax=Ascaphus truei TaxID=8439 RepID=UPI003F5A5948